MKTFNQSIQQPTQIQITTTGSLMPALAASAHEVLALLSAVTLATTIVMLSVWVAGTQMTDVLSAGIWGVGLIFFGLAVDNGEPKAVLQLLTGSTLLALAWLQSNVAADYVIAAGFIVAAWVAVSVFKRLR